MDFRECRVCHETKGILNFGVDKKGKDGRNSICKECRAAIIRKERGASKKESKQLDPKWLVRGKISNNVYSYSGFDGVSHA
jgi:hypothetical protein